MTAEQCKTAKDRVFRTETVKRILKKCFSNRHIRRNNGELKMETPTAVGVHFFMAQGGS